jgi:transmembrane sensor
VTPETDDDGAARWAVRLDETALTTAERADLDAWLAGSERRTGALLRAQAALAYLDRGRALSGIEEQPDELAPRRALRSRRGFLGTIAASGIAAALAGVLVWMPERDEIDTRLGEIRQVPLADGSVATVNTDSRLAIAMRETRRTVQLDAGEAWFRVAHDKSRPFVVEAGELRVQAVGTAFSVRRREGGADVLVTEGIVDVWMVGHEADRQRISAGSRGFSAEARPTIAVTQAPQAIERALAWRSGELALDGETLSFAVAEINRYNRRKLVLEGNDLGREQLVGYFRATEPEGFGQAVAAMVGAKVIDEGDTIRIVRAPK